MKLRAHYFNLGFFLLMNSSAFAFDGGYHGSYHSGGNYYHNGYYNTYHNNGWNGAVTYDDGVFFDDNLNDDTEVVAGVPAEGYYDPTCQITDDCSSGTCVLVNTCDQE